MAQCNELLGGRFDHHRKNPNQYSPPAFQLMWGCERIEHDDSVTTAKSILTWWLDPCNRWQTNTKLIFEATHYSNITLHSTKLAQFHVNCLCMTSIEHTGKQTTGIYYGPKFTGSQLSTVGLTFTRRICYKQMNHIFVKKSCQIFAHWVKESRSDWFG